MPSGPQFVKELIIQGHEGRTVQFCPISCTRLQTDIVPGDTFDLTGDIGHSIGDVEDGLKYEV